MSANLAVPCLECSHSDSGKRKIGRVMLEKSREVAVIIEWDGFYLQRGAWLPGVSSEHFPAAENVARRAFTGRQDKSGQ